MCFEQPLLQNSPTVLRRGHWSGLCSANDRARLDAFLWRTKRYGYCSEALQQSVTCFLLLMNLCSSVSSTMIYTYCNHYYLLKPVSVTIYVFVTTIDNYLESLLTLTTLASSPECSTLTHINCLLLSFTLTFIVCIVNVAICQLF